jgi:hypothetical protein
VVVKFMVRNRRGKVNAEPAKGTLVRPRSDVRSAGRSIIGTYPLIDFEHEIVDPGEWLV